MSDSRCSGIPILASPAAGAELVDWPLLCRVLSSFWSAIGEGRAPPALLPPETPPTVLTVGAATAGAAPPFRATSGAGLFGALLSKNLLQSAVIVCRNCFHDSVAAFVPCRRLAPRGTNEHALQPVLHRASQCVI